MSGIVSKNAGRASGIVGAGDIGADAVDSANIADDAIDSEHYTDGSIDNAHIADDAIDSEHYADGSIDNAHIADDAIDSEHYADGSIDQVHLATGVGGVSWQAVVTGATTMVSGRGYFVNTTSSAFTMTLPASPSIGDYVRIIDYAGTFDSNTCTVGRNSEKIAGASADMTVTTERAGLELVYVDSTQGWLLTEI